MEKLIALVVARGGSQGVKNKNLRQVGGVPLVSRAIAHALAVFPASRVCLSTDSSDILCAALGEASGDTELAAVAPEGSTEWCESFWFHHRRTEHAQADSRVVDAIYDAVLALEERGVSAEKVLLFQPTSPFRSKEETSKIVTMATGPENIDSLVSVRPVEEAHPARMYRLTDANRLQKLEGFEAYETVNRQQLPPLFIRDGGYYLMSRKQIEAREQVSSYSYALERTFPWSINIDSEFDYWIASNIEAPNEV